MPFRPLADKSIRVRLGTATFVMGPPGAFKTGFILYYALRLVKEGFPCLYFSADAEDFEVVERAGAALTGDSMTLVQQNRQAYAEDLSSLSNLRFVFDDSPTYDDIVLEVAAFTEAYGDYPRVIVVDNLMNVSGEQESEWAAMRDTAKVIHKLTRITGAALLVLHHASDDRISAATPAPRKSMQGKVSQLPKTIWSLALDGDRLKVAPVKNRWGPADESGHTFAELFVDPSRNQVFNNSYDYQNGRPA